MISVCGRQSYPGGIAPSHQAVSGWFLQHLGLGLGYEWGQKFYPRALLPLLLILEYSN